MCSNFYKIYSLWDYPHRSLEQDLQQRISASQPYSVSELKNILVSAIEGLRALQYSEVKHECLTTGSLLVD